MKKRIPVDPETKARLDQEASRRGLSHLETVSSLLEEAEGINLTPDADLHRNGRQLANMLGRTLINTGVLRRPKGFDKTPKDRPGPKRTFYHFTSPERLPLIARYGILKGDVPTTPGGGFNAPWLSTDGRFESQMWTEGADVDKSGVRLTVEVAEDDPLLRHWPEVAKTYKMADIWYDTLNTCHGEDPTVADDWYVYFGVIPPHWITEMETKALTGLPIIAGCFGHAGSTSHHLDVLRLLSNDGT